MDSDASRGRALARGEPRGRRRARRQRRVIGASRRASQSIDGLARATAPGRAPLRRSGDRAARRSLRRRRRRERLVYLSRTGDLTAYEELRAGFTAAVSHELRTPLARLLSLLETATLPGEDVFELVEQARGEVEQIRELIDEVMFLSELESGARVVSLGAVPCARSSRRSSRSSPNARPGPASRSSSRGRRRSSFEIRPRMLRVVAQNLAENAIRYAGPGRDLHSRHRARRRTTSCCGAPTTARCPGGGAAAPLRAVLPCRSGAFFSRDGTRSRDRQARRHAGRGHGRGARWVGRGLEIRCAFPAPR